MSVVAELQIRPQEFPLGRALDVEDVDVSVELERVVPAAGRTMPSFWAQAEDVSDLETFEAVVRQRPHVETLEALDWIDDRVLFEVTWDDQTERFVGDLGEAGATILLAATDNGVWTFRLRFAHHSGLAALHELTLRHDVNYDPVRVVTDADTANGRHDFGLTPEQREALTLAVQRGYFDVPRSVTFAELAAELDITEQSFSERVRRGVQSVLEAVITERRSNSPDSGVDHPPTEADPGGRAR